MRRRFSRARAAEAARESAGREAVALLFTGLTVHRPVLEYASSQTSPMLSGSEASADVRYDEEAWEPAPAETASPWDDDTLDSSFSDDLSWFGSFDTGIDEPLGWSTEGEVDDLSFEEATDFDDFGDIS